MFSVITLHNALPRADEQIARSTVQPQLKKLMEEQMLEVETKRDGFRSISGKNSYYLDYLCTRSGDSLNSYDYFRVRGEIWEGDGYGNYVMCISLTRIGEKRLFGDPTFDNTTYNEVVFSMIPAVEL